MIRPARLWLTVSVATMVMHVAAGTAAAAQPAADGRLPDWRQSHLTAITPATASLIHLAVCARDRTPDLARQFLATAPASPEEDEMVRKVYPSGITECPLKNDGIRIKDWALLRGMTAEALYSGDRRKPKSADPLRLTALPANLYERPAPAVARSVARCVVQRSPMTAHRMTRFNVGSVGEARVLKEMEPLFLACLPDGLPLQATRLQIRALIAEELYQASLRHSEAFTSRSADRGLK